MNLFLPPFDGGVANTMPSSADLKLYLKIEHTTEDTLLEQLLIRAYAWIETWLGRAIVGSGRSFGGTTGWPVVTSFRGSAGASDTDVIVGTNASTALNVETDYAARIEPVLAQAVLDLAAVLYQQRSPNASSESGGSVSASYFDNGIPSRVRAMLAPFRWSAW